MRILVTGGAGFIGSHVVDRLVADGHAVTVLDDLSSGRREHLHAEALLIEGDVADAPTVDRAIQSTDAVIHLAAVASVRVCEEEPERAARVNIGGTDNVFTSAAGQRIPVVYASSAAVYGDNPNLPLHEQLAPQPLGNYGRHKLENEVTAQRYAREAASVGLRFFNVYGPRQDASSPYSGVISKFMAAALAGEPLTFFGDGKQTRDFIFIGDVVDLIVKALAKANGACVFNGCTGDATSLTQLAAALGTAIDRPLAIQHAKARAGEIRHSQGDPTAARAQLAFRATTALEDGLRLLAAHG